MADFLLRESEHEKVRGVFETAWIYLDDIKIPEAGLTEAKYCLAVFDRIFGSLMLSWRRWISTAFVLTIFFTTYYFMVEIVRLAKSLPFRPPFHDPHLETYFPIALICGVASLSMTRFMLVMSIKTCLMIPSVLQTLAFIVLIVITSILSDTIWIVMFVPVVNIGELAVICINYVLSFVTTGHLRETLWSNVSFNDFLWGAYYAWIGMLGMEASQGIAGIITNAIKFWNWYPMLINSGSRSDKLTGYYLEWAKVNFALLRVWFAVGFLILWMVVRPIYNLAWRLLLRLTDRTQRGPIACTAFILWILVKLIELSAVE